MKRSDCFFSDEELFIYLDGEIDSERKAELDHHLASCPECSWRFQLESRLKSMVGEACSGQAPSWLKTRIISALEAESSKPEQGFWAFLVATFSNRPFIPIGIVAVLVAAFFISIYSIPHRTNTMPLVTEAIHEHYEYLEHPSKNGFASSDPVEISEWLLSNAGMNVDLSSHKTLPPPNRACVLTEHGETIGYVGFDYQQAKVSLFLFKEDSKQLFGPKLVQKGNIDVYCGRCTDMNYALWRDKGLINVLVGDLPEENLMQLADSMF